MFTKHSIRKILSLFFILFSSILLADLSDNEKINILTDYLVKQENKNVREARNEAIATVYGKPVFNQLSYDDNTEMFFGRVKTTKSPLSRRINFYMPKKRAHSFMKNKENARIEVTHKFKNDEVELTDIELNYEGVKYPMTLKTDTTMSLKIGGYFVGQQDTELRAKKNGIGGSIDLQELFDLKENTSGLKIDLGYEFNQKHKLTLSYYRIKNSNTKEIDPIEFAGNTLKGSINLQYNTTIYKFSYIYSAYRTNKFELMTRIGLHVTNFETIFQAEANLNGTTNASKGFSANIPAPLPVFGLGLNYDITDKLSVNYNVDYFYLSTVVKGTMVDTQIELDYMIYEYLGLAIGINSTKLNFRTKVDDVDIGLSHDISGAVASMIFRY